MKKTLNTNEVYQITKDTVELYKQLESSDNETVISKTELICNAIDSINPALLMSKIKGVSGVVSNLKLYKTICLGIKEQAIREEKINESEWNGLELLSERILDKLRERLFPNDAEFIKSRYRMADQLCEYASEQIKQYVEDNELKKELSRYNRIFIYEEDFESLSLRRILNSLGIDGFECFVADTDSFRIDGSKIISISEARISEDDVLIFTARKALRKYDRNRVDGHKIKNILEISVFDDKKEDEFNWTLVE